MMLELCNVPLISAHGAIEFLARGEGWIQEWIWGWYGSVHFHHWDCFVDAYVRTLPNSCSNPCYTCNLSNASFSQVGVVVDLPVTTADSVSFHLPHCSKWVWLSNSYIGTVLVLLFPFSTLILLSFRPEQKHEPNSKVDVEMLVFTFTIEVKYL